jgi:murein DD-endopeptidase MepM/ murein hydrolase activator NlpD
MASLTPEQRSVLRTIVSVGHQMGATPKAFKAAVEAGLVESSLRNLNFGDRDSLGVFQQRPSQGWGSPAQVTNVEHAAREFFSRAIPQASKYGNAGELAQAVQRSAFPSRYNQRGGQAASILAGLGGNVPALANPAGRRTSTSTRTVTTTPAVDNSGARRQALAAFLLNDNPTTDPRTGLQSGGSDILDLALQMRQLKDSPAVTKQVTSGAASSGSSAGAKSFGAGRGSAGRRSPVGHLTSESGEHPTLGLAGFPARDYFAKAGSAAVAPINGRVVRLSGHDPANGPSQGPHGPLGWSVYIKGDDGHTYFLTHMGSRSVKVGQTVRAGQRIGTVANYDKYGTPSHIHMGVQ